MQSRTPTKQPHVTERMYLKSGLHTLLAAPLLAMSVSAYAAGLGEATLRSGLAQPLRVEIALVGDDVGALGSECFRVLSPSGASDDLPWVRSAQMRLEQTGNRHALIVTTRQAIHDPALMLGIQVDCGVQVRREYALLLGPAAVEAPRTAPADTTAAPPAPKPTAPRGRVETWTAAEGESPASIAAALLPNDRAAQRRAAREIVRANPQLFAGVANPTLSALPAGTQLQVPMPGASSSPRIAPVETASPTPTRERKASAPQPAPEAAPQPRARRSSAPNTDRLTVTTDDADGALRQSLELDESRRQSVPDESARARLRREQQLILAIDDRISTTLELNERIRQLEAAQQRLQAENQRLAGLIAQQSGAGGQQTQLASAATPIDWRLIAGGAALLLAAIAGSLAWRRRRIRILPVEPLPVGNAAETQPDEDDAEFESEALTPADIWPEREGSPLAGASQEGIEWTPPTLSPGALGPSSLLHIDDEVEEHDSAVELAEIMMSFGRVQGAAETLADFIRANPKQAVRPWIKLLEVYKAASMRVEFDALAGQLNKTFNVKAVTWDEFDQVKEANESVEQMGHIIGRILNTWRTRECQVYLHTLLRDNRKGTRQGFPLGIVDDILCLNGVLEIELGAFKPTPEELHAMETPPPPPSGPQAEPPTTVMKAAEATPAERRNEQEISFDEHLLPPSRPRAPAPAFEPERTESMIEFNLDEDLPPLKPRDQ